MGKFARTVNGAKADPIEAVDLTALDSMFHPDYVAKLKAAGEWFASVTDAEFDALLPDVSSVPSVLSSSAFIQYCWTQLGGGEVGMDRFGEIVDAMMQSNIPTVVSLNQRYQKADTFAKDEVITILTILKTKLPALQILNPEITAIATNWPVA